MGGEGGSRRHNIREDFNKNLKGKRVNFFERLKGVSL